MRCDKCRKNVRLRARENWRTGNPEKERLHRRRVGVRNAEKRRASSREIADSTGSKWSGADEHFLMKNIGTLTQREIGSVLGRSLSSVEVKIWRLRKAQ